MWSYQEHLSVPEDTLQVAPTLWSAEVHNLPDPLRMLGNCCVGLAGAYAFGEPKARAYTDNKWQVDVSQIPLLALPGEAPHPNLAPLSYHLGSKVAQLPGKDKMVDAARALSFVRSVARLGRFGVAGTEDGVEAIESRSSTLYQRTTPVPAELSQGVRRAIGVIDAGLVIDHVVAAYRVPKLESDATCAEIHAVSQGTSETFVAQLFFDRGTTPYWGAGLIAAHLAVDGVNSVARVSGDAFNGLMQYSKIPGLLAAEATPDKD